MAVVVGGGGAGATAAAGIAIASNSGCFSSTAVAILFTSQASGKKRKRHWNKEISFRKTQKHTYKRRAAVEEYGKFVKINKKYFSQWKNRRFELAKSRGAAGRKWKTVTVDLSVETRQEIHDLHRNRGVKVEGERVFWRYFPDFLPNN